jgi:RNA polymerase sigma-70 factor, ECF subfamily
MQLGWTVYPKVAAMSNGRRSESAEAQRGEQFMSLYSGHQRRLYLYTLTLLPTSIDAEDVLQEANLVLWRKFDQYRPDTNFFAWACRIIHYEVLKYRERHARAAKLLEPDVLDRLAQLAVEQVEHLDEFHRQALIDCMARLSLGDREVLRQRYVEALAVRAMAAAMNRSPNAVSKSLGRIRRLLLDCIRDSLDGQDRPGGQS